MPLPPAAVQVCEYPHIQLLEANWMHLEELKPFPASAAFVTWAVATYLGQAGSSSPPVSASELGLLGNRHLWYQLNGFDWQYPGVRQCRHMHCVPPLPHLHYAMLCSLLLLERGRWCSAPSSKGNKTTKGPSSLLQSWVPTAWMVQHGAGYSLGWHFTQMLPWGSRLHQFPPTAASTRCQRCRGGAGSPPAALGAGPLASAASSSVRLSAGQALYFCRCNGRVGAQGSVLLPTLCTACDHIKHPTISTPTHASSASSCFDACGTLKQLRAGSQSQSAGAPREPYAGTVLPSWWWKGKGRPPLESQGDLSQALQAPAAP